MFKLAWNIFHIYNFLYLQSPIFHRSHIILNTPVVGVEGNTLWCCVVQAMARVAVALNWTYVAVVHTDSMTGMEGFTEFVAAAKEAGVCVTLVRQINETGTTR